MADIEQLLNTVKGSLIDTNERVLSVAKQGLKSLIAQISAAK